MDAADTDRLVGTVDATGLFPGELLVEMLAGYLDGRSPEEGWLTAEIDGAAAAVAHYAPERMTEGTWNLLLIAVHPEHQGKGVGQALMCEAESALQRAGQRLLLVETSGLPEFARTRDFYRRLDYVEEARIRDFYDAGDDKVVFWKAL